MPAARRRHSKGYILVYMPRHPWAQKSGYVAEHRIVMEQKLGRFLLPLETVHHKNGVKDDNRPDNLEVWYSGQPAGQRPEDLVAWALEILRTYPEQVMQVAWAQRWVVGFRGTDRDEESYMPSQTAPCGDVVEGGTQSEMGSAYSQHLNSCSQCQQIQEEIRNKWFGPKTGDPRDE